MGNIQGIEKRKKAKMKVHAMWESTKQLSMLMPSVRLTRSLLALVIGKWLEEQSCIHENLTDNHFSEG